MKKEMEEQLETMRSKCVSELAGFEAEEAKIHSAIQERRRKIAAFDTLLGKPPTEVTVTSGSAPSTIEAFTPVRDYWRPILQVLVECGGRGRRLEVMDLVGKKMKDILTPADYAKLPKAHNTIRWRNRVAWQASNMRAEGLMNPNAPRGVWEITDAGRKWLNDNL